MISNRSCLPVSPVGFRTIWKSSATFSRENPSRERKKGVSPLGRKHVHFNLCSSANANPAQGLTQDDGDAVPLFDTEKTKVLVETAMLAAVSGMTSLLLTLLKLESYLYYLMPFPLVLASLRSGFKAAQKTLVATFFLMFVLLGPARALTYVLLFGFTGMTLGALWTVPSPWWITFPACTGAYVAGMMGYVCTASFLLRENLFRLVAYNIQSLAGQFALFFGIEGTLSTPVIITVLIGLLALRGLIYVGVLHVCYAVLLVGMDHRVGKLPQIVERALWPTGKPQPSSQT
ncbi:hypothetical protein BSKO_11335 [Bryopsis sp. KO-2023]|nr:hypothetical protein BSKO_11335 [Bryopsis sp. KO-2023]